MIGEHISGPQEVIKSNRPLKCDFKCSYFKAVSFTPSPGKHKLPGYSLYHHGLLHQVQGNLCTCSL